MMSVDAQAVDTFELLSTKLVAPPPRAPLVNRERLLEHLDAGLVYKATLICAPAGFGKTTLVSEWIAGHSQEDDRLQIAWTSLEGSDNDPVLFWRYVLTACQAFGPQVSEAALDLLNKSPRPPFETLLTLFINQMALLTNKAILVIEEYHAIVDQQIHETLAFFIDHLPATLHLVLLTRSDPPLPLARLRAHNELSELRGADLRFNLDETQAYLRLAVPLPLPDEVVNRLAERTEGWAAGLHLVALALQQLKKQEDIEQYLANLTGSHRPILDYLVADVFDAQSETIQEFLLQTSYLNRLTGPLCDAVTGLQGSSLILEQLELDNLFLEPLDGARRWYRYHALFAEAMQHYARLRLGMPKLRELSGKASLWYEGQGMITEAIESALYAQDYSRAASLIERIIAPRLVQNEFPTLRRWMESLPEEVLQDYPEICLTFASSILFTSDRHSPETKACMQLPLQIAEEHYRREQNCPRLGEVLAFRCLVDWLQREFETSFSLAKQALELLPDSDKQWHGISLIIIGTEQVRQGKLNSARQSFSDAISLCEAGGNIYGYFDSMLLLGEVSYLQGELLQAEQIFRQVLERLENATMDWNEAAIRRGWVQLGLGMLALEWNDLKSAEQAVSQAVSASQEFSEEDLLADSPLILAQVKFAQGDSDQAQRLLAALIAGPRLPYLFRFPRACQAGFALQSGDIDAVQRMVWTDFLPGDDIPLAQREQEALIIARLRIEQGEAEAAIQQLERWLVEAQDHGRTRSELEIKVLLSLAYAALGERAKARVELVGALSLGKPEGYRRIFLDEGVKLGALLQEMLPEIEEEELAAYGRALLYAISREQTRRETRTNPASGTLGESLMVPLTEQENRVLRLIAAGLSNSEVAEELYISVNTVKTHVKRIYEKLNVNSREEARGAARHLNLI